MEQTERHGTGSPPSEALVLLAFEAACSQLSGLPGWQRDARSAQAALARSSRGSPGKESPRRSSAQPTDAHAGSLQNYSPRGSNVVSCIRFKGILRDVPSTASSTFSSSLSMLQAAAGGCCCCCDHATASPTAVSLSDWRHERHPAPTLQFLGSGKLEIEMYCSSE